MSSNFHVLRTFSFLIGFCNQVSMLQLENESENILMKKSKEMLSFMNQSADPCDNFYSFACGNWATLYPVSNVSGRHFTNYYTQIREAYNKRIIQTLRENWKTTENDFLRKLQIFYQSCLNVKTMEHSKLLSIINEFGEMPAVAGSSWQAASFDWIKTLALIKRKFGFEILIGLTISTDFNANHVNRLYIENGQFALETKSMYLDEKREIYRKAQFYKIAMELKENLGMEFETALQTAADIFRLERQLALGMLDEKDGHGLDAIYSNTTIEVLQQKYAPVIDFAKLVNITFGEVPTGSVYEGWPIYFSNLADVISTTNKSVIANYIFYQLIQNFVVDTKVNKTQRQLTCLEKVTNNFAHEIDTLMHESIEDREMENGMLQIWHSLKNHFKEKLHNPKNFNWFSNATRQAAIKKLEVLKFKINILNKTELGRSFENLSVTENSYIDNLISIFQLRTKIYYETLHSPPQFKGGAYFSPAIFLAGNVITMPVSFLQPFYVWESHYPAAVKYAVVGFLLAHEIIHAFDNTGRRYCVRGNLRNWWDKSSEDNFLKLRACFMSQYHNYIYGGQPLPRLENQDENIADNGGIQMAFETFNEFLKSAGNDRNVLPNFHFKGEQLFFLAFAQFFCGTELEYLKNLNAENEHTPNEFRVLGPLSNYKTFAEVYNCPIGSKMNPMQKCLMY